LVADEDVIILQEVRLTAVAVVVAVAQVGTVAHKHIIQEQQVQQDKDIQAELAYIITVLLQERTTAVVAAAEQALWDMEDLTDINKVEVVKVWLRLLAAQWFIVQAAVEVAITAQVTEQQV
jgi:hypothetical protein